MNVFFHFYTQDGRRIGKVESEIPRNQHKKSHLVVWRQGVYVITGFDTTTTPGNEEALTLHCKPTSSNKVFFLSDDGEMLESPEFNNGKV